MKYKKHEPLSARIPSISTRPEREPPGRFGLTRRQVDALRDLTQLPAMWASVWA